MSPPDSGVSRRLVLWFGSCALVALALATAASASPTSLDLSISNNRVNAKEAFQITYESKGLAQGAKLSLETQIGTAHVWKKLQLLPGMQGTATTAGRLMGSYAYRVVATVGRHTVAISPRRQLYSYAPVSLGIVCHAVSPSCTPGLLTIGATLFEYEFGPYSPGSTYPNFVGGGLESHQTTCRSATIQFALYHFESGKAYYRLLQANAEPQEAETSAPTEIGTFNMTFDGKAWELEDASTSGSNIVIRGTFMCYTPTGQ